MRNVHNKLKNKTIQSQYMQQQIVTKLSNRTYYQTKTLHHDKINTLIKLEPINDKLKQKYRISRMLNMANHTYKTKPNPRP